MPASGIGILERIDANVELLVGRVRSLRLNLGPVAQRRLPLPTKGPAPMFILTDIQHVTATLEIDDAAGNPVADSFASPPTWSSSDATVVTVTPAVDGLSADIASTGKLGTAQVSVQGTDVDGRALTGLETVQVVTSAASTFKLQFGTPADK